VAVRSTASEDGLSREYTVLGQIFFASSDAFVAAFDFKEAIDSVRIDVSRAHFWDVSAIAALDKVILKFRREGTVVEVVGLNEASATMIDKFAIHDKPGALDSLLGH
jgi:SulP family sulfate permease